MDSSQLKCPEKQNINDSKIYFYQNTNQTCQKDDEFKINSPFKIQYSRCKEIAHLSQKRLIQSLKKMPIRKGSLFENSKMKRLDFNFHSISCDNERKSNKSDNLKMPDLLKIKLKKQLETIKKNDHSKSKHKTQKSQNQSSKINKLTNILFDSNNHEANHNSKKYEIIKASLKNIKKRLDQPHNQKKNTVQKSKHELQQINLNEKRKVTKYFHLLNSANQNHKVKSVYKKQIHYPNRVKTEALEHSRLFSKGLELQGTKIQEDNPFHQHKLKLAALFQQTIVTKQMQEDYLSRKRKQSQQKIIKIKNRVVKSQGKTQKTLRNNEISPWANLHQQKEIGNNFILISDYD